MKGLFPTSKDAIQACDFDEARRMEKELILSMIKKQKQDKLAEIESMTKEAFQNKYISVDFLEYLKKEIASIALDATLSIDKNEISEIEEAVKTALYSPSGDFSSIEKEEDEIMLSIAKEASSQRKKAMLTVLRNKGELTPKLEAKIKKHIDDVVEATPTQKKQKGNTPWSRQNSPRPQ